MFATGNGFTVLLPIELSNMLVALDTLYLVFGA
jgi:hypothetical protein